MASGADIDRMLRLLGLGEYEAKAYRELLKLGKAKPLAVSKSSGVPQAKVYGVLDSLCAKGAAVLIPGAPKEYAVTDLGFVERGLGERERELAAARSSLEELARLRSRRAVSVGGDEVWLVREPGPIKDTMAEAIEGARSRVACVGTELYWMHASRRAVSAAVRRGVPVQVVARDSPATRERGAALAAAGAEVRYLGADDITLGVLVIDRAQFLLGVPEPPLFVVTRNAEFVGFGTAYFERLWAAGRPSGHAEG